MRVLSLMFLLGWVFVAPAFAQEVNYQSLQEEGFGDIGALLQSMSPEQRADVMREAEIKRRDLEKMTPEQRAALLGQLHAVHDTIDVGKIDPAKLNTKKIKSTAEIQDDLGTYKWKYDSGKIHNGVVRERTGQQGAQ